MKIEDVLKQIPNIEVFLTPDEMDESTFALKDKYPQLVDVQQVGESEQHHPIYRLKIGDGERKALIFGCPHPNEPIGAMMIEHLSRILCENEELLEQLNTTFYFIKCVDPDGLNLNKGWLKGPFTYENYASHFYRPASFKQVEWTFPFHYKTYHFDAALPETKAIMSVIDEVKPDLLYSLHNSSFGGVYWYISQEDYNIIDQLENAAKRVDLPLSLGEPEVPYCQVYKDAVFELPQLSDQYDYLEKYVDKDPAEMMTSGGCSADYLDTVNKNATTIICEMPYFYVPVCSDLSLCDDITRKEAIFKSYEIRDEITNKVKEAYAVLEKYADLNTSCMIALKERIDEKMNNHDAEIALMEAHPEQYDVPATKASYFDNLIGTPWYMLLAFGMVITAAKQTLEIVQDENIKVELQTVIDNAKEYVHKECEHINEQVPCVAIPIQKLVSVQMESALIALGMK